MNTSKAINVRYAMPCKNRGIALLLMLSLLIVAFTTVAIARLSLNDAAQKRQKITQKALTETRDAIMAWTLTQNFSLARPAGTLPCPDSDTNRDGRLNNSPGGAGCVSRVGLVPFRDLGIPEPLDSYGNPLWYAVAAEYVGNANALMQRNSSLASTLILEGVNGSNQRTAAFILIASNEAQSNQTQIIRPVMAPIVNFLEGKNADGNLNIFTDQSVPDTANPTVTYNDQVISMPMDVFWSTVEMGVLSEVAKLLRTYKTQCGAYPWAVNFSDADDNSDNGTLLGRVPLGTTVGATLPTAWGLGCAPSLPTWLTTHWQRTLFYSMCAPPSAPTSCLQLQDANSVLLQTASVILIAPGIPWGTQNRSILQPAEFFDKENSATIDNVFQKTSRTEHTADFNDTIYIVE